MHINDKCISFIVCCSTWCAVYPICKQLILFQTTCYKKHAITLLPLVDSEQHCTKAGKTLSDKSDKTKGFCLVVFWCFLIDIDLWISGLGLRDVTFLHTLSESCLIIDVLMNQKYVPIELFFRPLTWYRMNTQKQNIDNIANNIRMLKFNLLDVKSPFWGAKIVL